MGEGTRHACGTADGERRGAVEGATATRWGAVWARQCALGPKPVGQSSLALLARIPGGGYALRPPLATPGTVRTLSGRSRWRR